MNIFLRFFKLLFTPVIFWKEIEAEDISIRRLMFSFVLPLTVISSLAVFAGYGLIGVHTGILDIKVKGTGWGIYLGIKQGLAVMSTLYITAFIIERMAPLFGTEKNLGKTIQLLAYSSTALWLGSLCSIVPFMRFYGLIFGCYGIFILHAGIVPMKQCPRKNRYPYLLTTVLVCLLVFGAVSFIAGKVLGPIFGFGVWGEYGRFAV